MQIKGKEKTQTPLCHGPQTTALYLSWNDFLQIIKEIHFIFVCMYAYMFACTYLFISCHRKNDFLRGEGSVPFALGWMWHACLVVSGHLRLLQILFAEKQSGPLSFREASHGKQQPLPNTDLRLWAPHSWACCEFHYFPQTRRAREESHGHVSRCTKTSGLWK